MEWLTSNLTYLGDYPIWLYIPVWILGTGIVTIGSHADITHKGICWPNVVAISLLYLIPVFQVVFLISGAGYCIGTMLERYRFEKYNELPHPRSYKH